ncbi:MAG: O-antigen ligase C-terminal domain-containing protein [Burkholderiales bacterium]|nr:O-antigen ligase C-terminal domain-containing protein [Burkholderiales bacterium]
MNLQRPSTDAWLALAVVAIVAPTLLAAHEPPSVTFYNQVLALFGWGLWAAALAGPVLNGATALIKPDRRTQAALLALTAVLLLNAGLALISPVTNGLPWGLAAMGGGMLLSASLLVLIGWRVGLTDQAERVFDTFCEALAWAGLLGMLLALVQVFHPAWADGNFIAEPTMPGRAVGNLRQPNHFSTLLVWSCCAVVWLGARDRWPRVLTTLALVLMIGGVVLTASRTGMIGMALLVFWGWRDRSLPRQLRVALMLAPVIYGAWWGGMWLWSHQDTSITFAAEARLHDHSDISSSRFKIWANVLDLIKAQPWTGVGYGEFNLAWTMTPFPTRPVAFFDHTHNLVLQWAVEFGLPLTALMLGALAWAVWALLKPRQAHGNMPHPMAGAASVMVLMVGVHSLLEYPLWYSYFLLPAAFAFGIGLAAKARQATVGKPAAVHVRASWNTALVGAAVIMSLGAAWCAWDYQSAVSIYAPRKDAGPLAERIAHGQRMPWFGYQADYADVTGADEDEESRPPQAFSRTLHNLVDARLMMAYARSLAEHGEVDKARFVVARLKEFHNSSAEDFLAACDDEPDPMQQPFQCKPPERSYTWKELRP